MIEIVIPKLRVLSPNQAGHWAQEHVRKKKERQIIHLTLKSRLKTALNLPVSIILIREGVRLLDEKENLPMSFKCVKDAIAKFLLGGTMGQNDEDPRLHWEYRQEKAKKYGIRIEFHEHGESKGD